MVNDYYYDDDDDGHHHNHPHHHNHHQIVTLYKYNHRVDNNAHKKTYWLHVSFISIYLINVSCSVKLCSLTWQGKGDSLGWQTNVEKIITKYIVWTYLISGCNLDTS